MKIILLLILTAIGGLQVQAQYSIASSTISGGGTTASSAGGTYAIQGTIAQTDASGALAGGVLTVTGGFWPGLSLLTTAGAPSLEVEQIDPGHVRIHWLRSAAGFVLDEAVTLASPPPAVDWKPVAFPYQTNANQISVTVPFDLGQHRFYRLRRP